MAAGIRAGVFGTCVVAVAGVLVLSEFITWRASYDGVTVGAGTDTGGLVVVLGFRSSRGKQPNFMQRWRTRIALRTVSSDGVLLFTGGAVRGKTSEASVMAQYAVARGFDAARIVLEEESRTTWENVSNNIDVLREATTITFASNTLHARRARRYLAKLAPNLTDRIRRGRDFVWGEYAPFKTYPSFTNVYGGASGAKDSPKCDPLVRVKVARQATLHVNCVSLPPQ